MVSLLSGLVAGLIGSLAMAVLMMATARGQPGVNTLLVARALGRHPSDPKAKMGGMLAHFLYGTGMGGVFAVGSGMVLLGGSLWINGLAFGIVLFLIAAMAIMPAAGVTRDKMKAMPKGRILGFLVFHLVYGLVLAAVLTYGPQVGLEL